jgi:hypothetical protein
MLDQLIHHPTLIQPMAPHRWLPASGNDHGTRHKPGVSYLWQDGGRLYQTKLAAKPEFIRDSLQVRATVALAYRVSKAFAGSVASLLQQFTSPMAGVKPTVQNAAQSAV